jgi:CMP-N-acetylneuraminic acid synthetase
MRELGKTALHIPAREGSKRVPRKNLRLMNGKPMISYVIEAALQSGVTEHCYVNTDSEELIAYVKSAYPRMKIYLRAKELCNDRAQSDDFNADMIRNLQPDTLIMINPVCPLIEAEDIQNVVEAYKNSDADTLITSCSTHMQTFCEGKPVNIDVMQPLAPSQENPLVTTLNWAITLWEAQPFLRRMEEKGFGVWGDKLMFYDIEPFKAVKVSVEDDFLFAEKLIKTRNA